MAHGFLPISKQDMIDSGIEQLDFVYVSGDAYVDHPHQTHFWRDSLGWTGCVSDGRPVPQASGLSAPGLRILSRLLHL